MTPKDLSELRRRLSPDDRNPTLLRGCYVGSDGHLISEFSKSFQLMPEGEFEKYMSLFKRVLSGTQGQNLLTLEYTPAQVMEGQEYALLSRLRETGLKDEQSVSDFFGIMRSVIAQTREVSEPDGDNYLILLLHDAYDVPFFNANDEKDADAGSDLFRYILCAVCPVKQARPALSYNASRDDFLSNDGEWSVCPPSHGFLFPAFEDHCANLYETIFYTRDQSKAHEVLLQNVLGAEPPLPAQEQKEVFCDILQSTLEEECDIAAVTAIQEQVGELVRTQKNDKKAEPLRMTGQDIGDVLRSCGISEERAAAFEQKVEECLGEHAAIPAVNLAPPKQFSVTMPAVSIKMDPEMSSMLETRMLDGRRYLLIPVDGEIEVNGINVALH